MNKVLLFSLIIIASLKSVTLSAQTNTDFNVKWNNGLRIQNSDKSVKIKIGGRIQYDMMFIRQDSTMDNHFATAGNGAEVRRARFFMSGSIYENIDYKLQVDFANNALTLKDAYIRFKHIPIVGNLQVGHFKEPIGLNTLTSSKYLSMMERPVASYLDLDRRLGLMIYNQHFNKRLTWQLGYFLPNIASNKYIGNGYHITSRIVGLPIYDDGETYKVLHIGLAYSHGYLDQKTSSFRFRPEAHLAPKYINFKVTDMKNTNIANLELAFIYNQFSIQGEYHHYSFSHGDTAHYQNSSYSSGIYYATFSWMLTGEHRNYSKKKTAFDIVKPKKNYGKNGWGAFELAFRISHTNFNVDDLDGGEMDNYTLGLNWYLNPAVKVAANYIHTNSFSYYHGSSDIFQMRFQVAF
ncbi:MAG: hypothetical protein KAG64_03245 [Bacteroidales bacterium]|nr:hypothetical protein [Bacteroidales bacterium]